MASYTAEQLQQSFGIPAASAQALLSTLNTISSSASEREGSGGVDNNFSPVSPEISGLGFDGLDPGGFDADASIGATTSTSGFSGFSGLGDTVSSALGGLNPSVNVDTPFGDFSVSVADVAMGLGLGAFTGVPGLGMVANAIGSAFGPSTGTAFGMGEQTGSGISGGQVSGYGSTQGGPTGLGINAYGQAVDPNAEAVMGMANDAAAAAAQQAEVSAAATADAMGEGVAADAAAAAAAASANAAAEGVGGGTGVGGADSGDTSGSGVGGGGGEESGWADGGIMQLGGYSANQRPSVDTSNFYLRTPEQGFSLRTSPATFGEGNQPATGSSPSPEERLNFTGNYGRSTSEVTPQAKGIPQEAIDYFRLKNQEEKSTSYNVGIRAMFPDGVVPDFIDRVLRPKSANASFGQSESTFQNVQGDTFTNSDRRRGIGGQGQILRGMFRDNAPTVGGQYFEPNKFDKQISGNVNIPVRKGNLNLSAAKLINEGRGNSESYRAALNHPVGPGNISAEGKFYRDPETGQDENSFGVRFRVPLN